jgi:chromosome segregation ATPase
VNRDLIVTLVIALSSSTVITAIINAVANHMSKKRATDTGYIDGRLQDWKERSEQSDKRIANLEQKLEATQRELAGLGRDFAGLEQYTAALEVIVRKLDPGAHIPPRPHRERPN